MCRQKYATLEFKGLKEPTHREQSPNLQWLSKQSPFLQKDQKGHPSTSEPDDTKMFRQLTNASLAHKVQKRV